MAEKPVLVITEGLGHTMAVVEALRKRLSADFPDVRVIITDQTATEIHGARPEEADFIREVVRGRPVVSVNPFEALEIREPVLDEAFFRKRKADPADKRPGRFKGDGANIRGWRKGK